MCGEREKKTRTRRSPGSVIAGERGRPPSASPAAAASTSPVAFAVVAVVVAAMPVVVARFAGFACLVDAAIAACRAVGLAGAIGTGAGFATAFHLAFVTFCFPGFVVVSGSESRKAERAKDQCTTECELFHRYVMFKSFLKRRICGSRAGTGRRRILLCRMSLYGKDNDCIPYWVAIAEFFDDGCEEKGDIKGCPRDGGSLMEYQGPNDQPPRKPSNTPAATALPITPATLGPMACISR